MIIAIFGAGGFCGSHLVEHFLERGKDQVVGLDSTDEKLNGISGDNLTFHKADVTNAPGLVDEMIREADIVVDLIAYAHPSKYVEVPLDVVEVNFQRNLDIVQRCIDHDKRLIQFSSCEVYGKPKGQNEVYSEDGSDLTYGPVHKVRWIYAAAKQLLERVIYAHGQAGDLEFTIVRPFNFIGPRVDYLVEAGAMGGPRVFAHFMSALLTGGPMYLVGGGQVHRTFLHIADATAAIQAILDHPEESSNQIFNIGNPVNNIRIRDLARLMMDLYEELVGERPRSELVEVSGETFYGAGYEDSDRLTPDISKLTSLGWQPRHDLRSTFRETMRHYLERADGHPLV